MKNSILSIGVDDPMEGAQRLILIVGVAFCEGWKRAPMKRIADATVPMAMEELVAMVKKDVP